MPPRIRSPTPSDEGEDMLASDSDSGAPPTTTTSTRPPVPSYASQNHTTPANPFSQIGAGLPQLPQLPALPQAVQAGRAAGGSRGASHPSSVASDAMDVDEDGEVYGSPEEEEDELDDDEDDYAPSGSGTPQPGRKGARASTRRGSAAKPPAVKASKAGAAATAGRRRGSDAPAAVASPAAAASAGPAAAGGALSGMKIKFKMGSNGGGAASAQAGPSTAASSPAPSAAGGRKKPAAPKAAAKPAGKKGKGKKKAETDESDVSLDLSDGEDVPASSRYSSPGMRDGSDEDGEEDELASDGGSGGEGFDDGFSSGSDRSGSAADVYGGRKTARQRAKEMGGDEALELMSLPNHVTKGGPAEKTEAEIALMKAEKSRKRKSQADKKLEDEKTETINRLLKKQVGRAGSSAKGGAKGGNKRARSKLNKSVTADGSDEDEDPAAAARAAAQEEERLRRASIKPTVARWVSSIRAAAPPAPAIAFVSEGAPPPTPAAPAAEPTFTLSYSLPEGLDFDPPQRAPLEPPMKRVREAPKSRRFSAEETADLRRKNEDGRRKVMLGVA
ncbi:hypothetical protein JCM10213_000664 [Rhodosporidiobolus nylandii]